MTRLGQMIYDDGVQDGMEKGMEKGEDRVNSLNSRLLEQNRADDVLRAARDSEYQKKLFAEFNL